MAFPERFSNLPDYAFPRLRKLLHGMTPGGTEINMTIGEPRHPMPDFLDEVLAGATAGFAKYPPNDGAPFLLEAMADWIARRFDVSVNPEREILALNGTREGLFNSCIALCPEVASNGAKPVVLLPNPFYQVYAVAALTVGAEPIYVAATEASGFLPDFAGIDPELLDRTQIVYQCSPSNPQGAVASADYLREVLELAEKHDFTVFSDECYSEVYRDAPPPSIIQVAREMGIDPNRVVIFHSLSKRSNLPGIRCGFAASGSENIARMKQLRNYAGAPLPLPLQTVAAAVWQDEAHVDQSRKMYHQKYQIADEIFGDLPGYRSPEAGFFLWLPVEDGEQATTKLWQETGVKVLPGSYLSRSADGINPGDKYIRAALVTDIDDTRTGLTRLRSCLY
jgi:N-succinyldiaminopimelate aminotransferase